MPDGKLKSVIFSQQFDVKLMEKVFRLADVIRQVEDNYEGALFLQSLLPHKRALLYFAQHSTRTRTSFEIACKLLGMQTTIVTDTSTSSEYKGESPLDNIQTLSEYVDVIAMRHPTKGFVEQAAWHLQAKTRRPKPIINAGSSQDQHPTQALLDAYTMYRKFKKAGGINKKVIGFVGDLKSRTVRSNVYLSRNYKDVKLLFCAPRKHQIDEDMIGFLEKHNIQYELRYKFNKAEIEIMDVIYLTRLQNDYDVDDPNRATRIIKGFDLTKKKSKWMKHYAIIMHPLPRRGELSDEMDQDERTRIWSQVRNGMWVRAALICLIFGVDLRIKTKYPDKFMR